MASEKGGLQLRSGSFGQDVQGGTIEHGCLGAKGTMVELTPYCSCTVRLHWTRHHCIMRPYTLVESYAARRKAIVERVFLRITRFKESRQGLSQAAWLFLWAAVHAQQDVSSRDAKLRARGGTRSIGVQQGAHSGQPGD